MLYSQPKDVNYKFEFIRIMQAGAAIVRKGNPGRRGCACPDAYRGGWVSFSGGLSAFGRKELPRRVALFFGPFFSKKKGHKTKSQNLRKATSPQTAVRDDAT